MSKRIVLIEWVDAYGSGGSWQPLEDVEVKDVSCETVGVVQDETDKMICVSQTTGGTPSGEDDGVFNFFCVPKAMTVKITELRRVDEETP